MKARLVLPAMYAALVGAALLWMFAHARETPFAGVLPLLVTLPWSIITVLIVTVVAPGVFDSSLLPGTLVFLAGAVINAGLLYGLSAQMRVGRRKRATMTK